MHRRRLLIAPSRDGLFLLGVAILAVYAAGCGAPEGPDRYDLWGTVPYEGEPVPSGIIVFSNKDTLYDTVCSIEEGAYESQDGKGHTGGKFKVSVEAWTEHTEAWEDEAPKLFAGTYSKEVELPAEGTELNLDFKKEDFQSGP